MLKKDLQATIAQHFLCPDSYVTPDGRHVLKGEDWKWQTLHVWNKSKGKCQHGGCLSTIAHVHHKIKRSKARDDRIENLEGLCIKHHNERHPEKQVKWSAR